ncbi:MAG: hypothetical protein QGF64_07480, partial [Candidatus Poseidoniia archaeon]|nr:hypothetical protein [Candidatus Poseidoniia archaeon]
LGAALLASNNSRFFQRDEIKYLFKKDKQQDYLINKYNKWKKLTNKIINFVKDWLDSNITDELQPEVLKADSRDLLEKIKEMEND